jgi:glutamyl-tRNA synthetase
VWDPVIVRIEGIDSMTSHAPLHPSHTDRGIRKISMSKPIEVALTPQDWETLEKNGRLRLKDLCNIELSHGSVRYIGNDLSVLKEGVKIAHWAPIPGIPAEVALPDGSIKKGVAEPVPKEEEGKVVQFERFGFVRIERSAPSLKAFFTHS